MFLSPNGRLVTAIDTQTPSFDKTEPTFVPTVDEDHSSERVVDTNEVDTEEVDTDENVPESSLTNEREEETNPDSPIVIQTEQQRPHTDRDPDDDHKTYARTRNSRTPMLAGLGLVSLLLGVSLVMFLMRSPDDDATQTAPTQSRSKPGLQTPDDSTSQNNTIAPGTLKALVAKIPTPDRNDAPEQLTSLASTNGSRSRSPNTTNTEDERNRSPFGGPTVAPDLVLPRPSEPRKRI
ncbi:MAG: hypothetical protein ACF787_00755, partial [Rhodopirellula sp. JB053]